MNLELECYKCKNSDNVIKHGKQNRIQRYRCNNCEITFSNNSAISHQRKKSITTALHLLLEGYKAQEIADFLELSYDTINNWKNKYLRNFKELSSSKITVSEKQRIDDLTLSFIRKRRRSSSRSK